MKSGSSEKVYEKAQYMIISVSNGFIVYNTNKPFEDGHTHLHSFSMAKTIIDNCIKKRKPRTNNIYLLTSHIRVTDDEEYAKFIRELIHAKKSKQKQTYRNRSK